MSESKNATRVAAGLKATLHNPNVSEGAKKSAQDRLEQMGAIEPQSGTAKAAAEPGESHDTRVLGGYKATLSNEHTSEEAKAHAREVLEAAGILSDSSEDTAAEEHHMRVLAGYKAALHNPRVSDAAKQHAREYLAEHDA
ncbi:hypothetical protein BV25DRAFT_1915035 [Artomyces pyxidatus]|uniref:Uncharacterized protein n=1 Tax=Artomyces pyxidatus TaxID=48021 RepID=A0ACB8T4U8_9AGAM|nr:hypothetical protein BV25DRAFT_1915035 [Artomyces pyxidatus]